VLWCIERGDKKGSVLFHAIPVSFLVCILLIFSIKYEEDEEKSLTFEKVAYRYTPRLGRKASLQNGQTKKLLDENNIVK